MAEQSQNQAHSENHVQTQEELNQLLKVRREKLAELQANEQPEVSSGGMEMT